MKKFRVDRKFIEWLDEQIADTDSIDGIEDMAALQQRKGALAALRRVRAAITEG